MRPLERLGEKHGPPRTLAGAWGGGDPACGRWEGSASQTWGKAGRSVLRKLDSLFPDGPTVRLLLFILTNGAIVGLSKLHPDGDGGLIPSCQNQEASALPCSRWPVQTGESYSAPERNGPRRDVEEPLVRVAE